MIQVNFKKKKIYFDEIGKMKANMQVFGVISKIGKNQRFQL